MTLMQKILWADSLRAERSHEEKPLLYWHQHRRLHRQNSYGRNACTRRKTLAIPTSTQKTRRAEFLWANAHMKKPHGSTDIKTEKLGGQNSYGRTLTWRNPTALLTSRRKNLAGRIPMGECSHKKKPHGSTDINTKEQNTCGTSTEPCGTSNGELLRAWLLWVILQKTCGQKSHGRPEPCGHSMGLPSTRSYGHLTCLGTFSVGQLLIFTFTLSPHPQNPVGSWVPVELWTRPRSSRKCRSFSLRWPFYRARSWFTTDITIVTS